ncbi:exocyst complex subunit 4 [Pelomyxa schiedti]|nr:exocyst complex subunit 4 [Pelomyxa schiedti]
MRSTVILAFALVAIAWISASGAADCTPGTICSTCVAITGCGWCAPTTSCVAANATGTGPLVGTCDGIWQHKHSQIVWRTEGSPINPINTEVFLLATQALDVPIEVIVPNAATQPLDLWINQDSSASMRDDIDTLTKLIPRLLASVTKIRPNAMFGYSVFVDKPIYPVGYIDGNNFEYRTEMNLTSNYNKLQQAMMGVLTYGNQDDPEASLSAVVLATCPSNGWRTNALKMIVTLTDADPQLGHTISNWDCWGKDVYMPVNDYDCDSECRYLPCYPVGTTWNGTGPVDRCHWVGTGEDYPTLDGTKSHLLKKNVFPVFAVSGAGPNATFSNIVKNWGFGVTVLLASDSSNVVDAILTGIDYLTKNLIMQVVSDPGLFVQSITPPKYSDVLPQTSYKFTVRLLTATQPTVNNLITLGVLGWGQPTITVLAVYPCYGCDGIKDSYKIVDDCGFCVLPAEADACVDCKGVPFGIAVWDRCGKCGGDGMTCLDCTNTPNGTAIVDACGVCGGDNGTCFGCDSTPSGLTYDLCGVCGGNNTCLDCQQVPFGNKTLDNCSVCGGSNACQGCDGAYSLPPTEYDQCGICGGNGTECEDCFGVRWGHAVEDPCGVCAGTSKCIGCDGVLAVPPMAYDYCGECGGTDACRGCDGILYSEKKVDACDVCGGSSACNDCSGVPFGDMFYDSCGNCVNTSFPTMDWCVGCDNEAWSGLKFDLCHVCNGSNACVGCDNITFSGLSYDDCGICGGNGTECLGCDGIAFSGIVYDRCDVCGGHDACVGCDDVPRSGYFYDVCGDCTNDAEHPACAGCDMIPFSGVEYDLCHICGGSNECLGCDGEPYSGARYDLCGVCGGNNECYDCAGTKWDTKTLDVCNVCGGNGSTCLGCDNVPFSGARYDKCGVCDGNNTCLGVCDNVPWSTKVWDDCHVCGGDDRAYGCDGVCFSGVFYDYCGKCGGTNDCVGCDGIPWSGKELDQCGDCGGSDICIGCDGLPDYKPYDQCGVCGGTDACLGCDKVPYSGTKVDLCGVCGGANLCIGCDGSPVGNLQYDLCGDCNPNATNVCFGCDNAPYSGKKDDLCGVCGGANVCLGCDGVAWSGLIYDQCGICNGTGLECIGCDAVQWSGQVEDVCGVCNGDGSTCTGCDGVSDPKVPPKQYDDCGVCAGNSSCYDCAGKKYGNQTNDVCGNCGGKTKKKDDCNKKAKTTSLAVTGVVIGLTLAAVGCAVAGFFIYKHIRYGANWYIPNTLLDGSSSSVTSNPVYEGKSAFTDNPNFTNPTDCRGGGSSSQLWAVCTIDGLLSLTETTVASIAPNFVTIQTRLETLAYYLHTIDSTADECDIDRFASGFDRISISTSTACAGAGYDPDPNRTVEVYVRSSAVLPELVNFSTSCECDPHWRNWNFDHFNESLGIPCDKFCRMAKTIGLGDFISLLAPHYDILDGNLTRFWMLVTDELRVGIMCPWDTFRSSGTLLNILSGPNLQVPNIGLVSPTKNPSRISVWANPYFSGIQTIISVLHPLFDKRDVYIGALLAGISTQATTYLFSELVVTPEGFGMIVSPSGCVVSTSGSGGITLFGKDFTFISAIPPCLNNSVLGDFSEFLSVFTKGNGFVYFNTYLGNSWIFTYSPLPGLPWILSVASPAVNVLSAVRVTVSPESIVLSVQSKSTVFDLTVSNTGVVPIFIHNAQISAQLACNITNTTEVTISSSTLYSIGCKYEGPLPFSSELTFEVHDAVTVSAFCYYTKVVIPVSITKDSSTRQIGVIIAISLIVVLLILSTGFLAIVRYLNQRIRVLSEPLNKMQPLSTPAEQAIQELGAIRNKKKLTKEDSLVLDNIIRLIASDNLHRMTYITQRKRGFGAPDADVDAFIMEQLAGLRDECSGIMSSGASDSMCQRMCEEESIFDNWAFSIFTHRAGGPILPAVGTAIFKQHGLLERYRINEEHFSKWLLETTKGYLANPFHNAIHAADTLQAANVLVANMTDSLPHFYILALFFSALIHDYQHPGVNNNFLYKILDPVAMTYNGISVLENMHIHEAIHMTINGDFNWLSFMTKEQFLEFHELVTSLILATDMARHVELLSVFSAKSTSQSWDFTQKGDLRLVSQLILKLADICNPLRPLDTMQRWAFLITEEFFLQGDEEERLGLTKSPFMDRHAPRTAKGQKTFIKFVLQPLLESICCLINPDLAQMLRANMHSTLQFWDTHEGPPPTWTTKT